MKKNLNVSKYNTKAKPNRIKKKIFSSHKKFLDRTHVIYKTKRFDKSNSQEYQTYHTLHFISQYFR